MIRTLETACNNNISHTPLRTRLCHEADLTDDSLRGRTCKKCQRHGGLQSLHENE